MGMSVPDYTLSQMRSAMNASVFPPGAADNQKNLVINKARELLYFPRDNEGGNVIWNGLIAKTKQPIVTQFPDARDYKWQTVTLPREFETVVVAYDEGGPIPIRNNWQVFGNIPTLGLRTLDELGNGYCGVSTLPSTGALITATTTTAESSGLILQITGTDINGNSIGETLGIPTSQGSTVTSINTYYSINGSEGITEVIKSPTDGNLIVNQLSISGNILFANYEPSETTPDYRRYRYNFHTQYDFIALKCKRHYYELSDDNEYVEFSSVVAMELAARAYRWYGNSDNEAADNAMAQAIGMLNGVERNFQAETAYGSQSIDPSLGFGLTANLV